MRIHVVNSSFNYTINNSRAVGNHWQGVQKVDGAIKFWGRNYTFSNPGRFHKWNWDRL